MLELGTEQVGDARPFNKLYPWGAFLDTGLLDDVGASQPDYAALLDPELEAHLVQIGHELGADHFQVHTLDIPPSSTLESECTSVDREDWDAFGRTIAPRRAAAAAAAAEAEAEAEAVGRFHHVRESAKVWRCIPEASCRRPRPRD